jgi:hypothetical protein
MLIIKRNFLPELKKKTACTFAFTSISVLTSKKNDEQNSKKVLFSLYRIGTNPYFHNIGFFFDAG